MKKTLANPYQKDILGELPDELAFLILQELRQLEKEDETLQGTILILRCVSKRYNELVDQTLVGSFLNSNGVDLSKLTKKDRVLLAFDWLDESQINIPRKLTRRRLDFTQQINTLDREINSQKDRLDDAIARCTLGAFSSFCCAVGGLALVGGSAFLLYYAMKMESVIWKRDHANITNSTHHNRYLGYRVLRDFSIFGISALPVYLGFMGLKKGYKICREEVSIPHDLPSRRGINASRINRDRIRVDRDHVDIALRALYDQGGRSEERTEQNETSPLLGEESV